MKSRRVSNGDTLRYPLLDMTLLHEAAHYKGNIGNPDIATVEKRLWDDCIQ